MSAEIPIEMIGLPERLRADFTGLLPEATSGIPEWRETNFLTRALAAFAVHKLAGCPLSEAANSVVDGGDDGGIDAVLYNADSNTLWVVQSKYHRNGRGEPDLGSVAKFKTGLENLLSGKYTVFESNPVWKSLLPVVKAAFENGGLLVRAALVYSGINTVSEDRIRMFEDLRQRFSSEEDYLQIGTYGLTTIHDWITGADQAPGVPEVELTILKPGWVKKPYETVYGMVPLAELAASYKQHGKRLIAANIRGFKGSTEVNDQIAAAAAEEPENFFYLNNGLTAYCERLEVSHIDRDNADQKRIRAFGLSIVNGAQTLVSIANSVPEAGEDPCVGHVFVKVISLERCEDERAFAARITRSTNFQNRIGPRDLIAQEPQQVRIANQLVLSGIHYHYKDAADTPAPDGHNFTLEEATTACTCLIQGHDCPEFVARILSDRESLWSLEEIYPATDVNRSRYSRIFRTELSARTIWRAVQAQRITLNALNRMRIDAHYDFKQTCRWIVLSLVLLRTQVQYGQEVKLNRSEQTLVADSTRKHVNALLRACNAQGSGIMFKGNVVAPGGLRVVFGSPIACQHLRDAVLSRSMEAVNLAAFAD